MLSTYKEGQAIMHVINSFQMALRLPFLMDVLDKYEVFFAMMESWSINMRISLEFFNIANSSQKNKDFNCSLLGYNKRLNKKDKTELMKLKDTVDKFVVHFSNERISQESNNTFNEITIESMQMYASLLVKEIVPFLKHLKQTYNNDFEANYNYIEQMLVPYNIALK